MYLHEVVGLTANQVEDLRRAPHAYDPVAVLTATGEREAAELAPAVLRAAVEAVLDRPCG